MKPRLVHLADWEEKKIYPLDLSEGEKFSIGRNAENNLVISASGISRRHCEICLKNDEIFLRDLKSHNGTYLNDEAITESVLKHGDRFRIGKHQFLFLIEESDEFESHAYFDDALITKTEISFFPEKDFNRTSSHFDSLIKLGKALDEAANAAELQKRFLEIILESVPAKHGAILFFDVDSNEPKEICTVGKERAVNISRTVCERVRREKVAILSNDLTNHQLQFAQSLVLSQTTSLLAVPLRLSDGEEGLIYLDTDNHAVTFSEENLHQTTAVSFLLSAALQQKFLINDLQSENRRLLESLNLETDMLGESPAIRKIFELTAKVAATRSNVLISGESGTGKELVAKSIHKNSPRRHKQFIAVNCAAINENLFESELFGHEKGAFTGATSQKKGKFEVAEGGTIFFDEIGEIPLATQAKLLRVLQEHEFERVGGTKLLKADVRVIAATNRDLHQEVKNKTFREDLFFRLNVVEIKTPPLRERKSDIPILVKHFIEKYSRICGRKVTGLSPEAKKALLAYNWQGNVRELENAIERAIVVGSTEEILREDLPENIVQYGAEIVQNLPLDYHQQVKAAKQEIIRKTLNQTNGNYTKAARLLGIAPSNLHRLIRELRIREMS